MPMCSRRHATFALVTVAGTATLPPALAQPVTTTASGLQIIDTKAGTGASPKTGQICVMHYTGWLYENGVKGKKFELVGRSRPAVRISDRHPSRHRRLGRRRRHHEGRRQAHADHPAGAPLRRARRRQRHSAECDPDLRRRTARDQRLAAQSTFQYRDVPLLAIGKERTVARHQRRARTRARSRQ